MDLPENDETELIKIFENANENPDFMEEANDVEQAGDKQRMVEGVAGGNDLYFKQGEDQVGEGDSASRGGEVPASSSGIDSEIESALIHLC